MTSFQITKKLQNYHFFKRYFDTDTFTLQKLVRAEMALHRWCEHECNGDIQRDERDNLTYRHYGVSMDKRYRCPDRETGALKRIEKICKEKGLHYYYQSDPRGCALYISDKPMTDSDYSKGFAVC